MLCEPSPFSYFVYWNNIGLQHCCNFVLVLIVSWTCASPRLYKVEHWTLYFTYWYNKILVSDHNIIPKYLYLTFLINHLVAALHARHKRTLHSYYLLHINIASYCQWCLDGPESPDKQNFNKKNLKKHGKFESINYTLLNEKRLHDDEKKKFTYPVELTILLLTIYHS